MKGRPFPRKSRPADRANPRGTIGLAWAVRSRPIPDRAVRAAVRAALAHGGRAGIDLDVALVSDAYLAELHGRFLGDPSPTDVISFDLGEDDAGPSGEIYVSVDRAREVARRRGASVAAELTLYVVHGALHLCGYDDRTTAQRKRMRAAEAAVLAALGVGGERSGRAPAGARARRAHRKTEKTSERRASTSSTPPTSRFPRRNRGKSSKRPRAGSSA